MSFKIATLASVLTFAIALPALADGPSPGEVADQAACDAQKSNLQQSLQHAHSDKIAEALVPWLVNAYKQAGIKIQPKNISTVVFDSQYILDTSTNALTLRTEIVANVQAGADSAKFTALSSIDFEEDFVHASRETEVDPIGRVKKSALTCTLQIQYGSIGVVIANKDTSAEIGNLDLDYETDLKPTVTLP